MKLFKQKSFWIDIVPMLGAGVLILYFAIFILRQIMEPRLIGRSLGLHPLLALFAGYAGWRFFGFLGMALGPLAALLIKTFFFASGEKKLR